MRLAGGADGEAPPGEGYSSGAASAGAVPSERTSRAFIAASCSASFFERPRPTPSCSPSTVAAAVKSRSCGGAPASRTLWGTAPPARGGGEEPLVRGAPDPEHAVGDRPARARERLLQLRLVVDVVRQGEVDPA